MRSRAGRLKCWRELKFGSEMTSGLPDFSAIRSVLPRHGSHGGPDQEAGLPKQEAGGRISVIGVHTVVLRGEEQDIAVHAANHEVSNPKRLRIDITVCRTREKLGERRRTHAR